ncbi:vezatin [Protopterus annectens]|uniref:vezatin n=1 Tax=Protopterus annectens TaxID=7888 RepID=UPI001CF9ED03|nr:vezatin [Protopterus annectens]
MTEEFDEEVVFQNSPLYQYLQDIGRSDFEVCPAPSRESEPYSSKEGQQEQDIHTTLNQNIFLKVTESLRRYGKRESRVDHLDIGFRIRALRTILEQEVLLPEDVELIELLDPSILSASWPQQQENGQPPMLFSPASPNIWDAAVLVAFISAFIATLIVWNDVSWVTWGPGLLVSFSYLVMRGMNLWQAAKLQIAMRKCCIQLEEITASSRAFTNLMRKALRLIQETEVISRGFTLVSAACPFNKTGQQPGQHLIGLRKAVYRSVRASFQASRLATRYMLTSYPLNSEIDNVTNYICVVPLKELGLGLGEDEMLDEQVYKLTDGYSLPALKVLYQLWIGQSSEFFRRLALLLSPALKSCETMMSPEHFAYRVLSDVTKNLPQTLSVCLAELKRSYEFHRYFEAQHYSKSERCMKPKQKSGDLNNLCTAVRSLQLHLKALLNEVIILEDELDKLASYKEQQEITSDIRQDLEQKLKLIKPHMQASNNCWEEAVLQVKKMERNAVEEKGIPKATSHNMHAVMALPSQPVILIEDRDPVPEEQELEAYVEDCDSEDEYQRDEFYSLSSEVHERQKQELEESRRVLQELKSVLGFKASEVERQKWKMLLFNDQACLKPVSPVESVGSPCASEIALESDAVNQDHNCIPEDEGSYETNAASSVSSLRTEYISECCAVDGNRETTFQASWYGDVEENTNNQFGGVQEERVRADDGTDSLQTAFIGAAQTSVKQRLTELHGSACFDFSSALAAQVAARSYSFGTMHQEQTFGDSDDSNSEAEEDSDSDNTFRRKLKEE